MKYLIRSLERHDDQSPCLFCAIHGYSPFFVRSEDKARKFDSESEARVYALKELFTQEAGVFDVIPAFLRSNP
jgi:hypothetical protein